ncbi:hypothetical protein KIH86_02560 [Paenibacillus sp. HN-1]|uniref:hypothetical protein n=1 Tax=Paenibacillus TaxID=44249 RepID=UPI001CA8F352|nr:MULTISPECIES: hypothetical protein [Paenibacillus]MBY9080226.1 hypothetical protein [Paenibacillus sp. CGMCC 1.18879]MBY9083115.1 hypothetical protein [Paenibacillus sinensis]
MQKAFVVYYLTDKKNNLNELNELLNNGWRVVSQSAMGGGGGNNAVFSLVVLEVHGGT